MNKQNLNCVMSSDLLQWERAALAPMLVTLSHLFNVRTHELERGRKANLSTVKGPVWIFSNEWRTAVKHWALSRNEKAYVSILGLGLQPSWLPGLFWKKLGDILPDTFKLVAHSPLSYRFMREIENIPEGRVSHLSIPFVPATDIVDKRPVERMTVGTYARFTTESNLNYFMSVAHYIMQKRPSTRFVLAGEGPFKNHVLEMARELGLLSNLDIVLEADIRDIDVMLYHPLQNEHFLPVLMAAAHRIPVLACDIPGIENFIQDGRDGFIVPVNETKPMGELVLRLLADPTLARAMGTNLSDRLKTQLSPDFLVGQYTQALIPGTLESDVSRAA